MVDGEHMWETLFSIIYICCWRVNPFGRIRFQRDWEKLESGNCIMLAGEPIGRNRVQKMYRSLGERTHWKKQFSSIPMMCWADYHIGENHFQTMTRSWWLNPLGQTVFKSARDTHRWRANSFGINMVVQQHACFWWASPLEETILKQWDALSSEPIGRNHPRTSICVLASEPIGTSHV